MTEELEHERRTIYSRPPNANYTVWLRVTCTCRRTRLKVRSPPLLAIGLKLALLVFKSLSKAEIRC